ncbi:MAG: sigma-E factor regulatory protein RseB domain-containing protein, partial [Thiothrix litoralis]
MPTIKHTVSLAVLAAVLAWSTPSMADEASDLLAKMRNAVHTLNYSGTLVYSQGNELSNYQISHTLENGAEKESVVRLAQGAGEDGENVESFSLAKLQQVQPQMEQVYALDLGGEEFVANRSCQVVVARPRDGMRYLQRYCIEPDSGMLLKYSLVDRSHRSVEQLMFTALDISA